MKVRARLWLKRVLQVALGLALGGVLVEVAFAARDGGAFPHLNLYRADVRLGVRLQPHASERFALHDNPPSEIHINGAGLRGPELPAPRGDEILVLGDSQAFGLGVDDDQTFAARLARLTGRPVVNAGVPTYGPLEYNALGAELLRARKPAFVVYAVNMLNDLFEHARPNRERHRVWDGWAVRAETAPAQVFEFPGRAWLFGRSHAFYALRRYLHERAPGHELDAFASEGDAHDLLTEAGERNAHAVAAAAAQRTRAADLKQASATLSRTSEAVARSRTRSQNGDEWQARRMVRLYAPLAEASPGDIVRESFSEEARSIRATAEAIREAAKLRDQALAELARVQAKARAAIASTVQQRDQARARVRELRVQLHAAQRPRSALLERLRELHAACEQYAAEAVVVALPIDVQVSSAEWRKYGQEPVDMSATLALTEDMLADARALGMRAVDALPALRAAEPGAFLNGDIHLTAKGHVAVARAIAAALALPAPSPEPEPGLPADRSYPPARAHDYDHADQLDVVGQEQAGCTVSAQDEWLAVQCEAYDEAAPRIRDIVMLEGGRGEAMTVYDDGGDELGTPGGPRARLRAPLLPGDSLRARVEFEDHTQVLSAQRAADGSFAVVFEPRVRVPHASLDPGDDSPALPSAVCACRNDPACDMRYSPARDDCAASFPTDCDQQQACVLGDPDAWPTCPPGSARGEPSGRCLPLCSKTQPCAAGRCERWQGLDVCRSAS